jgi:hypothetical protein
MDVWVEDEAYEFMECGWHMSWMGEALFFRWRVSVCGVGFLIRQ